VRAGQSPTTDDGPQSAGAGLSFSTKLFLQVFARAASHPWLFALSQKLASLGTFLLSPRSGWVRMPAFTGWGYSKDFPRFAGKTFRERYQDKSMEAKLGKSITPKPAKPRFAMLQSNTVPLSSAQFITELSALGGHVLSTHNPTLAVIELLKSRSVDKIHAEPGILDEMLLHAAGIEFTHEPDPQILVGVTKAVCGLADTGSVLVTDGKGDPLKASLLPEVHIAILRSADIYPSLPDAMPLVKNTSAAVFITGPSRTADIEMTLTIGVHGPKEIHVFLT